jgi:DNA modification methylase
VKQKRTAVRNRIKELRYVRGRDLVPHESNYRVHPANQIQALRGILKEVGIAAALVGRELPGGKVQIIDGHARADVMPDEKLPVLILDVDEQEAAKLLATLDPLSAMAGIDGDALKKVLEAAQLEDEALKRMIDGLLPKIDPKEGLADPDAVPEPPEKPVSKRGDLWILGDHRLLCGDSSKAEDVDRLLDGAKVHLVCTDPPYGVRVEPRSNNAIAAGLSSFSGQRAARKGGGLKHHQGLDLARHPEKAKPTGRMRAKDRPLENDFLSDEEFLRLLRAWFGNISRVLLPGRSFYIWGGYSNLGNFPPVLKECGLYFSQAIVWNKLHPVLTRKDFLGCFELSYYGWKEGAAHLWLGPNNVPDLWEVKKVAPQHMRHLTEKAVELSVRPMQYSSRPGENVLDLFLGSASTLVAAEQTGRRCFGIEIDPAYADIGVRRWEEFTGKKAERCRK